MHRTRYRSRSRAQDQTPLRQRIRELAEVRVRYGYRRTHTALDNQTPAAFATYGHEQQTSRCSGTPKRVHSLGKSVHELTAEEHVDELMRIFVNYEAFCRILAN